MPSSTVPIDEKARLIALQNLGILDTLPEERFDRITRLACCIADVPIALVSLVDRDRQWFKSRQGLHATETSREYSFCAHTIHRENPLIIEDSQVDSRFASNPLVTGDPQIRFYAGHAIHAPDGARIGTLCVIDRQPRTLSKRQLASLKDLAAMIDAELLKSRLGTATSAAQIGVYERSANFHDVWWSEVMWEIFGQEPAHFQPTWPLWLSLVHSDDRERVRQTAGNAERARSSLSIQYRIVRPDGSIRHVQSIGSTTKTQGGERNRSISGVLLDVTTRVEIEERDLAAQQSLREQSHQAGKAEIASGVLHHVGNTLNSLGIANNTARRDLKAIKPARLQSASSLILSHRETLATFFTEDKQGQHLPAYLAAFSGQLLSNVQSVEAELEMIDSLLEQLRSVIGAQTVFAKVIAQNELLNLADLVDLALKGQAEELLNISIVRNYKIVPVVSSNRHKLLQILLSLIDNAREAIRSAIPSLAEIVISLYSEKSNVVIEIRDSGVGMSKEAMSMLWQVGYTTKIRGQGVGLHDSANAAREIGATIAASSDGCGRGACFTIRLPITSDSGSGTTDLLASQHVIRSGG